ncbi:MAG TPA: SMC family ATPase, partial [Actinomycetota bacterium]|nr:SMC family ATPase [Actinomycetota bacterium]
MRPLWLRLKGFTAFRDEVELDLSDLDLFAITGPTGSGKSSLLDAMTYALYGKVDRVGKQVGQLVSQGQPGMAVTLEFAVGDERYRVARRTPVKGPSRAVLERLVDGEWRPEPASGVRGVDAAVVGIVGLDYDAFTRSVLLPQNRFAEFLVGDAAERRRILTELLGLELFERLGKRAGEIRRQAEAEAGAHRAMLEREYAGASEEAVARAEEAARRAEERKAGLAEAEGRVGELLGRWRAIEHEVATLTACAGEARRSAGQADGYADVLGDLAGRLAEAAGEAEEGAARAAAAEEEASRTERELREAERRWGKATEVAALVVKAERLEPLRRAVDDAAAELERVRAEGPELERALAEAEEERAGRQAQATAAREALRSAQRALEHAQHADLAAAVREHVRVGQACPVCGATVERLPRAPKAPDLDRAKRELAKAERAVEAADEGMRRAERAVEEVAQRLAVHARELSRCEADLDRHRAEAERAEAELREALGGRPPKDPVA